MNCFVENCTHIGYPLFNASILDGRFSPDGLSFAVATYYGSFSVYGYGARDMYITTPVEQFFLNEYDDFEVEEITCRILDRVTGEELHSVDKGSICNSSKVVYDTEEMKPGEGFEKHYYQKVKKAENIEKSQNQPHDNYSPKECLGSICSAVNTLIKKDIERLAEDLKTKYCGKYSLKSSTINDSKLLLPEIESSQQNLKRLLKSNLMQGAQGLNDNHAIVEIPE